MKTRLLIASLALACATALSGCASQHIDSYAQEKPVLDLQQYFNGTLDAYGVFTDRSGAVVKRFTVVMVCHWEGDEGTLDEDFTYSDALKAKDGTWTDEALDAFVADPQTYAPGTAMFGNAPDPAQRHAIIEYLKTVK